MQCVCVHTCVHVEKMVQSLFLRTVHRIFQQDLSLTCNLPSWLGPASQAPGIRLSPLPQHWGYKHEPPCSDLFCVVLGLNSGPPHDCMAGTLPIKPSPQPLWNKSSVPSLPGIVITVPCSDPFSVRKADLKGEKTSP